MQWQRRDRGVNLTADVHLVPELKMMGTLSPRATCLQAMGLLFPLKLSHCKSM